MKTKLAAIAFLVFIVALIWHSKSNSELHADVGKSELELPSDATTLEELEGLNPAVASLDSGSITSSRVDEPVVHPSEKTIERYPENYVETFPGLDTYRWLYGGRRLSAGSRRLAVKFSHGQYKHEHTKLVDLEGGGTLTSLYREVGMSIVESFRNNQKQKYYFESGHQFDFLTEHRSELPVCVLNVDQDVLLKMYSDSGDNIVSFQLRYNYIERVNVLLNEYPGYRGVRLTLITSRLRPWLRSIECLTKVKEEMPDQFKQLELIHLSATLGMYFSYNEPEAIRDSLGWKAFEEVFPGHRLNER